MINQQLLQKALLSGNLPELFEKLVHQLMRQATEQGEFTGNYMPELIRRGFDKIIWDQNTHNLVKLKTKVNTQRVQQNVLINSNPVIGLRVQGDELKPQLIQIDSSFEKCPIAHAAGIPLYVKKLQNINRKKYNQYIIVRMMSQPSVGLAPLDWQYGGMFPPAPVVLVARSDSIQFNIGDWQILDDFEMNMLDDGPRKVTRQDFIQFVRSKYDDNNSNIALGALYQKGVQSRVNGLLQKAELNCKTGICKGIWEKQRIGIQFKDQQGTYSIQSKNLQKLQKYNHNCVKSKMTTNTQKMQQNIQINSNPVKGLRIEGAQLKPQLIQIDSDFEKCPIAHAAGIPLYVKRLQNVNRKKYNQYIIVRMMSQPSVGLAPLDWQYGGMFPPAPVVLVVRSDSIQFNIDDWKILDDFEMTMLDDGPRNVTRQDFVQFVKSKYSDNKSNIVLDALFRTKKLQLQWQPWKEHEQFSYLQSTITKRFTEGGCYLFSQALPKNNNDTTVISITFKKLAKNSFGVGLATVSSSQKAGWYLTDQYLGFSNGHDEKSKSHIWNNRKPIDNETRFGEGDKLSFRIEQKEVVLCKNDQQFTCLIKNQKLANSFLRLVLDIHYGGDCFEVIAQVIQKKVVNQCNVCLTTQQKLLLCGKCQNLWYCSKECQVKDWPKHKLVCVKKDK